MSYLGQFPVAEGFLDLGDGDAGIESEGEVEGRGVVACGGGEGGDDDGRG